MVWIKSLMDEIVRALDAMRGLSAVEGARLLLNVLGYESDRWGALAGYDDIADVRELALVFQFGEPELDRDMEIRMWDGGERSRYHSLIFLSAELEGGKQDKVAHERLTRRISGLFPNPSVILFKGSDGALTFGLGRMRVDKGDDNRDAIYGQFLMGAFKPLFALPEDIERLRSFSLRERLRWMRENGARRNFDGLYAAWLDAMSFNIFASARSRRRGRSGQRKSNGDEHAVALRLV